MARLTQVPPSVRFSVIATVLPNSAARIAAANAVEPEPRIAKPYRLVSIRMSVFQIDWSSPSPGVAHVGQNGETAGRAGSRLHAEAMIRKPTPSYVRAADASSD